MDQIILVGFVLLVIYIIVYFGVVFELVFGNMQEFPYVCIFKVQSLSDKVHGETYQLS